MSRGGKREGAGRRKNKPENHGKPNKYSALEIMDSVGSGKIRGHAEGCKCWKCLWVQDCEANGVIGQNARKYVWDREGGKPVDTVNHLHDKPIEHTVSISFFDAVERARKRATE